MHGIHMHGICHDDRACQTLFGGGGALPKKVQTTRELGGTPAYP